MTRTQLLLPPAKLKHFTFVADEVEADIERCMEWKGTGKGETG